jgi:putative membrane protein
MVMFGTTGGVSTLGERFLAHFAASILYTVIGLVFFALAFLLICKFTPFSIRKEIEEDQNTALAILIGSVFLGISIIIAAAIHGS